MRRAASRPIAWAKRGAIVLVAIAPAIGAGCLRAPPAIADHESAHASEAKPVVAWPGKPPQDLYARGEVRGFDIAQGGHPIGRSWGRYLGTDDAGRHVFETRIELLPPGGDPARSEGRLVLDAQGHLVEGFERSDAAELRFVREGDVVRITDGRQHDEIAYEPTRRDTAVMAFGAILHQELMLGMRRLSDAGMAWRLVPLSGSAPLSWEAELVTMPARAGDPYRIRTSLGEEITLRDGRIVAIDVANTGQHVREMSGEVAWPTWTIAGPRKLQYSPPADAAFAIREIELVGRADEPRLQGELLVPRGDTPRPAALFLSRMAGEDRYGFAGPPPVDLGSHEIHDALARAGFCVLRFDERGTGSSDAAPVSYAAQLEDARRAYRTLLVQPEVDPERVLVIGHGEGGLRALALGVQYGPDIDGIALLAAPGRAYEVVLRDQAQARLARVPPEVRDEVQREQDRILAELKAGRTPPELSADAAWLRELMAQDPPAMVARLSSKLLVAQGGKDFEVDPLADSSALVRAAKKGRVDHKLLRYPALDHLFKPEPNVSTPASYLIEDRRVDPKFLADLVAWAQKAVR